MKKRIMMSIVLICTVSLAIFTGCSKKEAAATTDKVYELKLGHVAEPDNPYALGGQRFADRMDELTGGKVKITIFPSSQLGSQQKLIESLVLGNLDFAMTSTAVLGQFEPDLLVFGYPYMFDSRNHAYAALDSIGIEVASNLEPKGVKLLGFFENGIRHMINNKKAIYTPEDMEDLKMRVMTTPVYVEMMKSLGADPTPMSFGEVYSACSTGAIDGLEVPAVHIWQKRFFEVNKYVSLTGHTYESEPLTISMKTWKKLPVEYQEAMKVAVADALEYSRKLARDQESDFFQKIKESGKTEINEVDRSIFADATKSAWAALKTDTSEELISQIQALN